MNLIHEHPGGLSGQRVAVCGPRPRSHSDDLVDPQGVRQLSVLIIVRDGDLNADYSGVLCLLQESGHLEPGQVCLFTDGHLGLAIHEVQLCQLG